MLIVYSEFLIFASNIVIMPRFPIFSFALIAVVAISSCTDTFSRNDLSVISPADAPRLKVAAAGELSSRPSSDDIALTISWSNGSQGLSYSIEMSADKSFGSLVSFYSEQLPVTAEKRQYTYHELNDILLEPLGMLSGVKSTLYIRIAAKNKSTEVFSNTVAVTVTPGAVISAPALTCSTKRIVLTSSSPDRLALSLSWTKNGSGVENTIEMCTDRLFLQPYSESVADGIHDMQYTYGRLNDILINSLGMKSDQPDSLFVRVVSSFASVAVASNIAAVAVTPDASDMDMEAIKLYVCGTTQSEDWTFDRYLVQYDSSTDSYAGAHYIDSRWGYRFYPYAGNWDYCYSYASGTALGGSLRQFGSANVPKPTPGLYFMNVSLGNFNYSLTEITSVTFTGFNDDWTLTPMVQDAQNPTVFTGKVNVTKPNPYRWQIVINNDWNTKLCANRGLLLLYDEGPATEEIPFGAYNLTVDLGTCTYTLTAI